MVIFCASVKVSKILKKKKKLYPDCMKNLNFKSNALRILNLRFDDSSLISLNVIIPWQT